MIKSIKTGRGFFMKKWIISAFLIVGMVAGVDAATAPRRRASTVANTPPESSIPPESSAPAARSAVAARGALRSVTPPATPPVASTTTKAARSAVSPTKNVTARAATTQKVINSGTKISGATKNTTVNEDCQNKYFGCMDAFCMLDNTSGGRCLCSNRNAELDAVLAEIEALDQQSYQMATIGVEQIEMGENADAVIAKANAVAQSTTVASRKNARKELEVSLLNTSLDDSDDDIYGEDDDIYGENDTLQSVIDGKKGDSLQRAASELCVAQVPECAADMSMLQLLYAQRIKADCSAYENSLKQQKNASQTKLMSAQKALQEAALEQLQNANKYDLSQCVTQFKRCMQTTAECGDDFSKCVVVSAMDNTNVNKYSKASKKKGIKINKNGDTEVEIYESSYDTLVAKKPMCEHVMKSCVNYKDQVWDEFLVNTAASIRSAELIAEDDTRQNCTTSISQCFQKACKDNIDPNDPEGSYDMCLTRPETMLNLCKIPLNACGIDASSVAKAEKSQIWNFVVARLASMRVDSCTKAVKSCLQSNDRCGKDYSNFIGLDLDSVIAMCPTDKLVGCQESDSKKSLAEISDLVTGIFLEIDNAMLAQCNNAVTRKMIEICGDDSVCLAFDDDMSMGTDSLLAYKDNNGDYVIEGLVGFGKLGVIEQNGETSQNNISFGAYQINLQEYINQMSKVEDGGTSAVRDRVLANIVSVGNKINQKIKILSEDPTIKMCVQGRDMSQIRSGSTASTRTTTARYPHLLDSSLMSIIGAGIDRATLNYNKKYNELVATATESYNDDVKATLCAAMATSSEPYCTKANADENGDAICVEYSVNTVGSDLFGDNAGMSGNGYETTYRIAGANIQKLASIQSRASKEWVLTDTYNNMLGSIEQSASYSPGSNACTIVTTTLTCKDAESLITKDTAKKIKGTGGAVYKDQYGTVRMRAYGDNTKIKKLSVETYHGTYCKEYNDPVVSSSTIEM